MSVLLTKEQIRSLYGIIGKGEVVAYGRAIKHIAPDASHRKIKLADLKFGSPEYNALHDRLMRMKTKPAAQVVESEVSEIF
jgi:hypothetical protein